MIISLIHPSRSRPDQAHKTYQNWMEKAANPQDIEYIMSVDITDPDLAHYYGKFETDQILVSDNKSAIDAINIAAKKATGNLFIVVSDDFTCPMHWDAKLLEALEGKEDYIVKTDDGLQPWMITLPIMDRKYYGRFGYIYYPGFEHMFCDSDMTTLADLLGRKIKLPIKFLHLHYSQAYGQPKDAINIKNDATWKQGEDLYLQRLRDNFGLKEIPGKYDFDIHHINWLKSKGIAI